MPRKPRFKKDTNKVVEEAIAQEPSLNTEEEEQEILNVVIPSFKRFITPEELEAEEIPAEDALIPGLRSHVPHLNVNPGNFNTEPISLDPLPEENVIPVGDVKLTDLPEDLLQRMADESNVGIEAIERGDYVTLDQLRESVEQNDQQAQNEIQEAIRMGNLVVPGDPQDGPIDLQGGDMSEEPQYPEVLAVDEYTYSTPVMKFGNLVFRDGLNITVRRGDKWMGAQGGHVAVDQNNPKSYRGIFLIDTIYIPFQELNEFQLYHGLLRFEHDMACTNWSQLYQVMLKMYGPTTSTTNDGFKREDYVTVVFFSVEPF